MLWSVWIGKCSKPKRLLLPSTSCSNEPLAETAWVEVNEPVGGCSSRGLCVRISRADFLFNILPPLATIAYTAKRHFTFYSPVSDATEIYLFVAGATRAHKMRPL
jgi:hypothetical protein